MIKSIKTFSTSTLLGTYKLSPYSEAQGMAEQRCPRVDTRRSAKDLEQQIRNMELRIQQGSSSTVNVDNITRRLVNNSIFLWIDYGRFSTFPHFSACSIRYHRITTNGQTTMILNFIWTCRFHDAKTKFEDIQTMVKKMRKFSGDLQQILKEREERYFRFRKEISKRINYFFIMNLSQRGYTGKLKVSTR